MNGIITEIQHASVHDGPGLRSVVFLKGCQMRCFWCHNPETISASPQLFFDESKCMGCGRCLGFCEAHKLSNGRHRIERAFCTSCFRCVETCFTGALSVCGRVVSVDEVMRDLAEDIPFYGESGGGVTVSGGEPLLQPEFCAELFQLLHREGVSCAVDTCGCVPWSAFETVLPVTDLFLYDLKEIDPETHRRATGVSNSRILENLRKLDATGKPIEIRMPIIPGINNSDAAITGAGRFLAGLAHLSGIRLLPYHSLAHDRYRAVDHPDTLPDVPSPAPAEMEHIAGILKSFHLNVIH